MKNYQYKMYEVVEPHLSSLYNTALRMSGNSDDATILVQNTLCKAIESSEKLKQLDNYRVWIFKLLMHRILASNQNIDFEINKHENKNEPEEFYLYRKLDEKNSQQETAKSDILEKFPEKDFKTALEDLPFQYRLLILLCDVEGFSYNEIATITDTSPTTVISYLYHGRKLFQQNLWRYIK